MDFLSNLKKMLEDSTYAVAKKTGEIVETSKTKYNIYDTRNDIEKLYADIGREIFAGYKEERNVADFIEDKCREIAELEVKMEELKRSLEK